LGPKAGDVKLPKERRSVLSDEQVPPTGSAVVRLSMKRTLYLDGEHIVRPIPGGAECRIRRPMQTDRAVADEHEPNWLQPSAM